MGVNELDFFWIIIIIFIIYFSEMKSAFLFALLSLLPHFLFAASRYYVAETGNDSNDGLSWQTAFAGVQKAIDAAAAAATEESPSEVWVAAGTYKHGSPMAMKKQRANLRRIRRDGNGTVGARLPKKHICFKRRRFLSNLCKCLYRRISLDRLRVFGRF